MKDTWDTNSYGCAQHPYEYCESLFHSFCHAYMRQDLLPVRGQRHALQRSSDTAATSRGSSEHGDREVLLEFCCFLHLVLCAPAGQAGKAHCWVAACSAPLGFHLSAWNHRGRFKEIVGNWPSKIVQIVVVRTITNMLAPPCHWSPGPCTLLISRMKSWRVCLKFPCAVNQMNRRCRYSPHLICKRPAQTVLQHLHGHALPGLPVPAGAERWAK